MKHVIRKYVLLMSRVLPEEYDASKTFKELHVDSLKVVELLMILEDIYIIEINEDLCGDTPRSLCTYMTKLLTKQ